MAHTFDNGVICCTDAGPPGKGCDDADLDGDSDVDQSDFGLWQRCYAGPDSPADPACDQ